MTPTLVSEVDLSTATAGMALAAPLLDANGAVLVQEGTVLSESMLVALRRRGVRHCVVRVVESPDAAALEERRERALGRLEYLFRNNSAGAGSAQLLAQLRAYRQWKTS